MALSKVDLPAPFAPITATTSPAATVTDTPTTAWRSRWKAWGARTSSSGSGIGGDPHVDPADRRRLDHRSRIALGNEGAGMKDDEPIDHGNERMYDVLDPDDRHAGAPNLPDQIDQRGAFVLGEATRN